MTDFCDAMSRDGEEVAAPQEQRGAQRFTSLIRAAKLVCAQGEFICVIRDVSATGIGLRTFHDLPSCDDIALELQNGESYELRKVRAAGREASFTFDAPIEVERLIQENWRFPKRQLRLNLTIPLTLRTATQRAQGVFYNMSQQGARIESDALFAIDQSVMVEADHLPAIRAKVRWRKTNNYGLVFDNTFTLRELALAAAEMQCPTLVTGDA